MNSEHLKIFSIFILIFSLACSKPAEKKEIKEDPLPSWNDGKTKNSIIDFVEKTTNISSPEYIDIEDRIATFDNDGTLWSEQPMYFQLYFAIDRVKALADQHPEWQNQSPFKYVINDQMDSLHATGIKGILELVMATHAGMTTEEFDSIVVNWISNSSHPKFNRPFTELVYQPMLELLNYLESHNYKTFIISGGGIDFMRAWTEEIYGIPRDQVYGSSIKTKFDFNDGNPVIRRLAEMNFIDDKDGKPVGINHFIGRRPVFAVGNSDGDLQMIQWTTSGAGPRIGIYIHHTDEEREFSYDRNSSIGHFDKGWDEAIDKGWTIVDMKEDWKVIYPFELGE